jgi:predicted RNase H-like nuclease
VVCALAKVCQQAGIIGKIKDADKCMTPQLQARVVESHPELCFWALAGDEPLAHSKHTDAGLEDRLVLLEGVYGPRIRDLRPPRGAARDDLYDACVLAWTASHVADGTAVHLPSQPQRDARGLRMEIVY